MFPLMIDFIINLRKKKSEDLTEEGDGIVRLAGRGAFITTCSFKKALLSSAPLKYYVFCFFLKGRCIGESIPGNSNCFLIKSRWRKGDPVSDCRDGNSYGSRV